MIADYNLADVSLEHVCDWTSSCTHHTHMDAPQYVGVDVPSGYLFE
jgi:hypothetical protein